MKPALLLSFFLLPFVTSAQDYSAIRRQLSELRNADQQYRVRLDSLFRKEKLEWNDPRIQALLPAARRQDSLTLAEVRSILDRWGWLGTDQIGKEGNQTLFLVIQHADSATMAHYFPLLAASYLSGNTPAAHYAMMLDRLLTDRGRPQVFGTQLTMERKDGLFVPFPITDPTSVDRRRKKMRLEPLKHYLKRASN